LTVDPETQSEQARRGGFCSLHTWQYENISSPYGVCTAYSKLTYHIAEELGRLAEDASHDSSPFKDGRCLLATSDTCKICDVRIEAEKNAIRIVADAARNVDKHEDKNLPACCLQHLVMVVTSLGKGLPAQKLLAAHARLLERTAEDLQRYALRHDALRQDLTSEEERQSSQLALLLLAGHRSVGAPWAVKFISF
jgi:hypothetical protein